MSSVAYPVPIWLPRRRGIVSPAEWLREKLREQEQTMVRAATFQVAGSLAVALTTTDPAPVCPAHQADDILLLLTVRRNAAAGLTTPAGWTQLHFFNGSNESIWLGWIRAVNGSTTNPTCDWSNSGDSYAIIYGIRNAITTGNPFTDAQLSVGTADPGVLTGTTTTEANQFVLAATFIADNVATASTVTATDPAAWTQNSYLTTASGADAAVSFHSAARATAGATGNLSMDFNGVPLRWIAMTAGVKGAVAADKARLVRVIGQAVMRAATR